ncbi:hypothetical protein [Streptomyces sp. SID161]|uniref:hypothetical protein n=1 Tax=Streptomyces sp. SID161 TaxID=2690251 RepID=UPI00136C2610|nr:hypothetical protein [Streptomyces sp. SID161]MYW47982.1 hypothetical protein [Streptomyces sp. SID161]
MHARNTVLTVMMCLALLSACAGGGSGGPTALDAGQAEAVLPDSVSVPGWETRLGPVAYPLKKAKATGLARCLHEGPQDSCARVRFFGASSFHRQHGPVVTFFLQTYRDEASARSSYGAAWKQWRSGVPGAKPMSAGKLGDQQDAVVGLSSSAVPGSKGVMIVVRAGSVIMLSAAESGTRVKMADSFLTRFADMFAKRAEEAQADKTPSAAVESSIG